MQNIQVTITGNGENYVLRKADNRYYVGDQEIVQTPLKDLEEEDKENYKESRDSGYSKQEALFIANLLRDGPYNDPSESYLYLIIQEIMLLLVNSDNRIYNKNIVYEEREEPGTGDILVALRSGNKLAVFNPSESFKEKILQVVS